MTKANSKRVKHSKLDQFGCISFDPDKGLEAALKEAEEHPVATEYVVHGDHITLHARAYVPPPAPPAPKHPAAEEFVAA